MPLTKGSSGPTTTILMSWARTCFFIPSKLTTETLRLVAIDDVPEFPGATKSWLHNGL